MKTLKNLKRKFWNTTKKNSNESYSSIDEFPLFNWEKCQEGHLRYVNVDGVARSQDASIWVNLYNQYLARFGFGEDLEKYLETKVHLTQLRLTYVQTGDAMLLNQIAIEEINLKNQDPTNHEGMTIDQCLYHLRKQMGQWLDKKKITIVDFKISLTEYVRSNK